MKAIKKISAAVLTAVIILSTALCASAASIRPYSETGAIVSVAHGGNWGEYPIYSKEAIESAFEVGADCVSVSVKKTADGKFMLCKYDDLGKIYAPYKGQLISQMTYEQVSAMRTTDSLGALTDSGLSELFDAIDAAKRYDKTIIIDDGWEWRKELYAYIVENDALSYTVLRTDSSKSDIKEFIELTGGKLRIIGKYHGNIIFNARSYVKSLSEAGCCAVQLSTKNPYGVIYNRSMLSAFGKNSYFSRAMASTYDPDMCGQRSDTESTWNDLIDRGYSMIETNEITSLVNYISRTSSLRSQLIELTSTTEKLNTENCSEKSLKEISQAREEATEAITTLSSYETLSKAKYGLTLALNDLSVSNENHSRKGVLKITFGKILAVILVTAAIVAGQVYTYKMQKRKKTVKS